jgi:putative glutamine amidotransferase
MPTIPGMPPRIGLTMYREPARWGDWQDRVADLLPAAYTDSMRRAGGAPLLLPPGGSTAEAEGAIEAVDALVLVGGADIDPDRYGAQAHPQTGPLRADRDAWELALTRAARDRDLPILGICRGHQLLNVALGGTLIQYLPDAVGHSGHRATRGVHGRELVSVAPDSRLAKLVGEQVEVAAYHRQAVDRLGAGLVPVAWAADGTIEAAELPAAHWVMSVQWHPEIAGAGRLFEGLVSAASVAPAAR